MLEKYKDKREREGFFFFTILQENRHPVAAVLEEELRTVEAGRRKVQLDILAVDMLLLEDTLQL